MERVDPAVEVRPHRATVTAMGLAITNIGFVIPWNLTPTETNQSHLFGLDQSGVTVTVWAIFMALAIGLVLGTLVNTYVLRWAAQLTAGMWCSAGSLYILAGDAGLGVLCLGVSIMALGVDWTCSGRIPRISVV